jgi:hypothetical protein
MFLNMDYRFVWSFGTVYGEASIYWLSKTTEACSMRWQYMWYASFNHTPIKSHDICLLNDWILKLWNRIWWSVSFRTVSGEVFLIWSSCWINIRVLYLLWSYYCNKIHNDATVVFSWLGFAKWQLGSLEHIKGWLCVMWFKLF